MYFCDLIFWLYNIDDCFFCRSKILVTHENSNIDITGEILQCLRPGEWLNDEVSCISLIFMWTRRILFSCCWHWLPFFPELQVINVYLELLKERERREPKKFLNCHFFNTFFYKKVGLFFNNFYSGADLAVSVNLDTSWNASGWSLMSWCNFDFIWRDFLLCTIGYLTPSILKIEHISAAIYFQGISVNI